MPSAESVFAPGDAAKADPALGKTDGTRKPAQESETKLMPGQNNDHWAPARATAQTDEATRQMLTRSTKTSRSVAGPRSVYEAVQHPPVEAHSP